MACVAGPLQILFRKRKSARHAFARGWHAVARSSRCRRVSTRLPSFRPCPDPSSAERIIFEKRRLEREEDEAAKAVEDAQSILNESLARLHRVRRQKKFVVEKGVRMVMENLRDMDEVEDLDRRELDAVVGARAQGAVDVIDWTSVGLDWTEGLTLGPSSASLGIAESSGGS